MYIDSFYTKLIKSNDKLLSRGYDYKNNGLIDKFVSPRMYLVERKNASQGEFMVSFM